MGGFECGTAERLDCCKCGWPLQLLIHFILECCQTISMDATFESSEQLSENKKMNLHGVVIGGSVLMYAIYLVGDWKVQYATDKTLGKLYRFVLGYMQN